MTEAMKIEKIEVIQSIQDKNDSVKLVKGKRTFARVFIGGFTSADDREYHVKGTLKCDQPITSDSEEIESLNSISIKTNQPCEFRRDRTDWNRSLNFDITSFIIKTNFDLELELIKLQLSCAEWKKPKTIGLGSSGIKLLGAGEKGKKVIEKEKIVGALPIYLTALVFRYWDSNLGRYIEPDPASVDLIRQFMTAAFPVTEKSIQWNTIYVSASDGFRALAETKKSREDLDDVVSKQLRALLLQTGLHRNQDLFFESKPGEVESNDDRSDLRTIYLGVFDDPSGRLGGAAADSPDFKAHNIVGVTVVDFSGQTGCHELAHMLGRKHPGVPHRRVYGPQIGQRPEDESKEVSEFGFLSKRADRAIGLNCDPRSASPKIYEHNYWFDLMTYRYPQWISNYTYSGLLERINLLFVNFEKKVYEAPANSWMVFGEYDLDRNTGKILYVLPTSYQTKEQQASKIKIIGRDADGTGLVNIDVQHRKQLERDMPPFGIFQATIPGVNKLENIELVVSGVTVDKYSALNSENAKILADVHSNYTKFFQKPRSATKDGVIENEGQHLIERNRDKALTIDRLVVFFYSVARDAYYLRYDWGELEIQITTTIKCKNPNNGHWETVLVTNRKKGLVWVSPNYIEQHFDAHRKEEFDMKEPPYSFLPRRSRPIADRKKDELTYKIMVTAGFVKREFQPPSVQKPFIQFPKSALRSLVEHEAYLESLKEKDKKTGEKNYERVKNRINRSGNFRPLREKEPGR